jgi:hypothetical protein
VAATWIENASIVGLYSYRLGVDIFQVEQVLV